MNEGKRQPPVGQIMVTVIGSRRQSLTSTAHACVSQERIRPVRPQAQELCIDKRIEHGLTHCPLEAAESLDLLHRQFHVGHFEILGADAYDHILNGSHAKVEWRSLVEKLVTERRWRPSSL